MLLYVRLSFVWTTTFVLCFFGSWGEGLGRCLIDMQEGVEILRSVVCTNFLVVVHLRFYRTFSVIDTSGAHCWMANIIIITKNNNSNNNCIIRRTIIK